MTPGLNRLSHAINAARQLAQNLRGTELRAEVADEIARRLREAAGLLKGKQVAPTQTGTLRFRLWARDPRCFWCGVETRIDGVHEPEAATLDHLHRKGQRAGRSLPPVVLACRRCNNDRGEPPRVNTACPAVKGGIC